MTVVDIATGQIDIVNYPLEQCPGWNITNDYSYKPPMKIQCQLILLLFMFPTECNAELAFQQWFSHFVYGKLYSWDQYVQ